MFSVLVVLVKLSVLAKWLARKTTLRTPIRGKEIISTKPRRKSAYDFFCLVYCFIVCLFCLPVLHNILHTLRARYRPSLFCTESVVIKHQSTVQLFTTLLFTDVGGVSVRFIFLTCTVPLRVHEWPQPIYRTARRGAGMHAWVIDSYAYYSPRVMQVLAF